MVEKTDAVSQKDLDAEREAEAAAQREADERARELLALLAEVDDGPVINAFKLMGGSLKVFRDPISRSNRLELRCDHGSAVVNLTGDQVRKAADTAAARLILNYAGSPGFIWTTRAVQALATAEAVTVLNAIR